MRKKPMSPTTRVLTKTLRENLSGIIKNRGLYNMKTGNFYKFLFCKFFVTYEVTLILR